MPVQGTKRAENLLLKISANLSTLRLQGYEMQESLAKRVDEQFQKRPDILHKKAETNIYKLAGQGIIAAFTDKDKQAAFNALKDVTLGYRDTQSEVLENAVSAASTSLRTQQEQLTSIMQAFQSAAQNLETALQRLQQIETGARNG